MLLKNTSRYPTDEVRELLAFAAEGLDLGGANIGFGLASAVGCRSTAYSGRSRAVCPMVARDLR